MEFRAKVHMFFDDGSEAVLRGVGVFDNLAGSFQCEEGQQNEDVTQSYKAYRHYRSHGHSYDGYHGRGMQGYHENDCEENRQKRHENRNGRQSEKGRRNEEQYVAEEPRGEHDLQEEKMTRGRSPWYKMRDGIFDAGYASTRPPSPEYDYTGGRYTSRSGRRGQYEDLDPDDYDPPRDDQSTIPNYDDSESDSKSDFSNEDLYSPHPGDRGRPGKHSGYDERQRENKETHREYDESQRNCREWNETRRGPSPKRSSFDDFVNSGQWPSQDDIRNPHKDSKGPEMSEPGVQLGFVPPAPPNHYATLGLEPTASPIEINKASKMMRFKTHLDKLKKPWMTPEEEAGIDAVAAAVGEAADVLKDPERRKSYDGKYRTWTTQHG